MNNLPTQIIDCNFALLQENSKDPLADSWKENQLPGNDDKLKTWKGNRAFICGSQNVRVIDIEGETKGNIFFQELTTALDKLNTLKIQTPSGGYHYYITNNDNYTQAYFNIKIKNIRCGEYRAKDCYVVAPGSTVNGKTYTVVNDVPIKEIPLSQISELLKITSTKVPTQEQIDTAADETRSGKEYAEVCRLQAKSLKENNKVLTYEEINKQMQAFSKWTTAHEQYRSLTYTKATKFIQDNTPKQENKKESKAEEKKIKPLPFIDLRGIMNTPKERRFVIQHMIQPNTVNQIYSPPACFKSLLALYAALCVANGKDFLGYKTKKCSVAYLDKENNRQILMERTKGLFKGMGLARKTAPVFFLLREGMLDDELFVEKLSNYVKENKIGLIIFDTLVRFNSGEENSAKDMNKLYQAFVKLQEDTNTSILFLHHTNRNGEFRGSSDLLGQVDTQFLVERKQKSLQFTLKNTKNRLGEINDITGEVLFGEDSINIVRNETLVEAEQEAKLNKFAMARAFILDYAQQNCSSALADSFRKKELMTSLRAFNTDNKINLSSRLIEDVLQHLIKIKILGKGEKIGVYVFKDKQNEKINAWINPIGHGGSMNA